MGSLLLAAAAAFCFFAAPAGAQQTMAEMNSGGVVLFPPVVTEANGAVAASTPATRLAQEVVTDSLRKYLGRNGANVVVYSRRLPSIERAVAEGGQQGLRQEDATAGPGDDRPKAQRFAEIIGATEYLIATIDNYTYDRATRTVSYDLSVARYATSDGSSLGLAAQKAQGISPQDVAGSRQEGSAAARAAEVAAEQVVSALYPRPKMETPTTPVRRSKSYERYILPGFAAALGVLFFTTR